ncbi:hypothetical protein ABI59_03510 [Acidobacteria bacterium Mor1]|nr:hypothetical protein ABI59_03510 [Acidobacteria bacterium Mor1]
MTVVGRWASGLFALTLLLSGCGGEAAPDQALEFVPFSGTWPVEEKLPNGPDAASSWDPGAWPLPPLEPVSTEGMDAPIAEQLTGLQERVETLQGEPGSCGELAEAQGRLGMVYLVYQFDSAAKAALEGAAILNPRDFRWHYYLGRLARRQKRLDDARLHYARAVTLQRDDAAAIWLASVYLEQGDAETAGRLASTVLSSEESAAAYYWMGRALAARNAPREALAGYRKARELRPEGAGIGHAIGMAYRDLGDLEKAKAFLAANRPGTLAPSDPHEIELMKLDRGLQGRLKLAKRLLSAGRYDVGETYLRGILQDVPGHVAARTNLAVALNELGRPGEAEGIYRELIAEDGGSPAVLYNLALIVGGRDRDEAIGLLERAVDADPSDADLHRELARLLHGAGRNAEAAEGWQRAVEADPSAPDAHAGWIRSLNAAGRKAEALERLTVARKLFPADAAIEDLATQID